METKTYLILGLIFLMVLPGHAQTTSGICKELNAIITLGLSEPSKIMGEKLHESDYFEYYQCTLPVTDADLVVVQRYPGGRLAMVTAYFGYEKTGAAIETQYKNLLLKVKSCYPSGNQMKEAFTDGFDEGICYWDGQEKKDEDYFPRYSVCFGKTYRGVVQQVPFREGKSYFVARIEFR
jgi:hypothetical protein